MNHNTIRNAMAVHEIFNSFHGCMFTFEKVLPTYEYVYLCFELSMYTLYKLKSILFKTCIILLYTKHDAMLESIR